MARLTHGDMLLIPEPSAGTSVPTLVTDGDGVLELCLIGRSYTRSEGRDGRPIWRADYPTAFAPGTEVEVEFTPNREYVWVCEVLANRTRYPEARREMWWRGDA